MSFVYVGLTYSSHLLCRVLINFLHFLDVGPTRDIVRFSCRQALYSAGYARHGYSRLVMEQQPAGDRRDRVQRSVDIVESRGNGPHAGVYNTRYDDGHAKHRHLL